MRIRADGNDEVIAERPRVLKVMNVAGMNDVEAAVTVHDGLTRLLRGATEFEELLKRTECADVGSGKEKEKTWRQKLHARF